MGKNGFYAKYIKRALDILLSGMTLLVFWPVLAIVAMLVLVNLGRPVIFRQERAGRAGRPFMMVKFRSMSDARDANGNLLTDTARLTRFGRVLRATSLDELPELWNIFKGDMSIVGPRPLPTNYLPYYTPQEKLRHDVRGGLTGLAQVNGRNSITWENRFAHDLEYVERVSFFMDVKILIATVKNVVARKDIGERGVSSPPDFHVYRKQQQKAEKE